MRQNKAFVPSSVSRHITDALIDRLQESSAFHVSKSSRCGGLVELAMEVSVNRQCISGPNPDGKMRIAVLGVVVHSGSSPCYCVH